MRVRAATVDDAEAIASVHVRTADELLGTRVREVRYRISLR